LCTCYRVPYLRGSDRRRGRSRTARIAGNWRGCGSRDSFIIRVVLKKSIIINKGWNHFQSVIRIPAYALIWLTPCMKLFSN
jgi:hypothetical protein